jgi:diaminopimelate decarboxylase
VNHFAYRRRVLHAEDVPLPRIALEVGTPTYVYAQATLERHFRVMTQAFAGQRHLLCYSVKANSNLAVLRLFAKLGSGFDIVSHGELLRVTRATYGAAERVVFSGVGKTEDEMSAALAANILLFNVESGEELAALDRVGRKMGRRAPFAVRVNPNVDAGTHRYISTGLKSSKFGVPFAEARALYRKSRRMKGVLARGLDCHIGSQLTDARPVAQALEKVAALYRSLRAEGFALEYLDVGGGLGITYRDERPPSVESYARVATEAVRGTGATLILEPGRVLVGNAGILLTRVLYRKKTPHKRFLVVDAGMNDLIRPALYDAHHELLPVNRRAGRAERMDVVGPVCESSDAFARDRRLVAPKPGEWLAVMSAGAYGMTMASNYNSRLRPAEVLVSGGRYRVVRTRETMPDLWRGESA